jgi:predicted transcriptional regulator
MQIYYNKKNGSFIKVTNFKLTPTEDEIEIDESLYNEIEKKRKEFQNELKLNEKIKQENNNLNIQNQLLLKEIEEKQNQLNELETNIQKTIKISVLSGEKCDTSEIILRKMILKFYGLYYALYCNWIYRKK